MRLTPKLLRWIGRVFNKDPQQFLALRLQYDGQMTWAVQDARLTTTVVGGSGAALDVDLTQFTVLGLAGFLAAQPGYSVPYVDPGDNAMLGAAVLLDGAGDPNTSNGDHVYGYSSVLWSFFESMSVQLRDAALQIEQALLQMSTRTASDMWLDELGGYYGIDRLAGEPDSQYGPRIIAEVLRPRENNVAIQEAIRVYTGQVVQVVDVAQYGPQEPLYSGSTLHNGTRFHNSASNLRYNLFDVAFGFDLINGSANLGERLDQMRAAINRLRAAGTHLRSLSLSGSTFAEDETPPEDDSTPMALVAQAAFTENETTPTDDMSLAGALSGFAEVDFAAHAADDAFLVITPSWFYNGRRQYDAGIIHAGGVGFAEML